MRVDKDIVAQVVEQILEQLTQNCAVENVLVLGSRTLQQEISLPYSDGLERKLHYIDDAYETGEADRYILPRLDLNDMADLAHGKAGSPIAEKVRGLLLSGKTVEVLEFAFTACENSAPPQLFALYRDYAETLYGFGLRPVKPVHKTAIVEKRVISEQDMEKWHAEGVKRINITRNALVTSLAEDCARKFGIEIQRDERGA